MNKQIIRKARNMWDDSHVFISKSGNGLSVPVYCLDKNGKMTRKLDEKGKQVFKNKYLDIQEFRHVNDYKRILELNGGDASVFPQNINDNHVDMTKLGSVEEILNAGAKLRAKGMTLDDAIVQFNAIVKGLQEQRDSMVKIQKENVSGAKEQEKGDKDDKKEMK